MRFLARFIGFLAVFYGFFGRFLLGFLAGFCWGFCHGLIVLSLRTKVHIVLCVQNTHYYIIKLYNSFLRLFLSVFMA
jgi:hypothetical protein